MMMQHVLGDLPASADVLVGDLGGRHREEIKCGVAKLSGRVKVLIEVYILSIKPILFVYFPKETQST